MSAIWAIISCICIIVWSWLLWEAWNTPFAPRDYKNFEEDDFDIEKQQQLKNKK
jgi:hypothetical protein